MTIEELGTFRLGSKICQTLHWSRVTENEVYGNEYIHYHYLTTQYAINPLS